MSSFKLDAPWSETEPTAAASMLKIVDVIGINSNASPGNSTGSITLNLGSAYTGESYTQNAMMFSSPGFISIPMGPGEVSVTSANVTPANTSSAGAQALAWVNNDQWTVIATRDTRTQDRPGNTDPGDTVMFAQQGRASVVCKANGDVVMSTTTTGDATGSNIILSLTTAGLYFNAPFGKIAFDAAGFRLSTSSGASFSLIGTANPIAGNQCIISASTTTISSGLITLGNPINAAVPLPVVYGVLPVAVPGIPILGVGVGAVTVAAAASTTVFVGI
jgi:hypothetical protein